MLRIGFVTLFPDMIRPAMGDSIVNRAAEARLISFDYANPRDFTTDRHRTVDDSPYGGEPGMLMKAEPIALAIESLEFGPEAIVIVPEPAAPRFSQAHANELARLEEVIFVCGHYEGIDERVSTYFNARRYSVGDFVVTGGELPAALIADAVVRQLPGVLGNEQSLGADSFYAGLLSAPNYTRPEVWRDISVPEVLISGHHAEIAKWRRREALRLTQRYRPELLELAELTAKERAFLSDATSGECDS
jgi:tRNA (guanine37-N1)-methyltransferase